jgi:rare lipoprotein A
MSGADDLLLRRLVGAATVFLAAFLLAWLLPQPQGGTSEQAGTVVLRMRAPEPRARLEPSAQERVEAPPKAEGAAALPERASEAPPPPATPAGAGAGEAVSVDPAPPASAEPEPAAPSGARQAAPGTAPASADEWWIQAAAYSDRAAARRGRERVAAEFSAGSRLREVRVDGRRFWRLQVGPLAREDTAERLAERLRGRGFQGARVFREGER